MSRSVSSASYLLNRRSRARASISLGAAFALFCTVLFGYEPSLSQAGFLDELFGRSKSPHALTYNGLYDRSETHSHDGSRRHARQSRRHTMTYQARRQVWERHKLASVERRNAERRPWSDRAGAEPRRDGVDAAALRHPDQMATASPASIRVTREVSENADRQSYCVRSCDGYHFKALPISKDSDIVVQQTDCQRLCPGAESVLFVAPSGATRVEDAKSSRTGESYPQLVARISPGDAQAQSCSCQTEASAAASTRAAMSDPTLRPGDTVVTAQGVRVVRRGSHYPFRATDFLSLAETRDSPVSQRSALYAIERALKTPQGRIAVANSDRRRHGHKDRI